MPGRRAEILLVDDDPGDVQLTREAFEEGRLSNRLHVAEDGEQAMAFLRREGAYARVPRPDLILLDLNLPKMDGLEVLRRMRSDYRTKLIPVAIFTSSLEEQDLINGYSLGANSYVRKPTEFSKFSEVIAQLVAYWTTLNEPPPPGEKIWAHHFDRPA